MAHEILYKTFGATVYIGRRLLFRWCFLGGKWWSGRRSRSYLISSGVMQQL